MYSVGWAVIFAVTAQRVLIDLEFVKDLFHRSAGLLYTWLLSPRSWFRQGALVIGKRECVGRIFEMETTAMNPTWSFYTGAGRCLLLLPKGCMISLH